MKYLFIILVMFQNYFAQSLSVSLTFDKSTYLMYEMSKAFIELKNISSQDIQITQPFSTEACGSGIRINLTDINNRRIPAVNMATLEIWLNEPIILRPGKSLFTILHLSSYFGNSRPDGAVDFMEGRYLEPGKYNIQVEYTYIENNKRTTITSNNVELEIISPTQEDMVVYSELKKAGINDLGTTIQQKITNLLQMIKKYPSHVYTLNAYDNALLFADNHTELQVNTDEIRSRMYDNFPTSTVTLMSICQMVKNDNKLMEAVMSKLSKKGNENKKRFERYIEFIDRIKSLN